MFLSIICKPALNALSRMLVASLNANLRVFEVFYFLWLFIVSQICVYIVVGACFALLCSFVIALTLKSRHFCRFVMMACFLLAVSSQPACVLFHWLLLLVWSLGLPHLCLPLSCFCPHFLVLQQLDLEDRLFPHIDYWPYAWWGYFPNNLFNLFFYTHLPVWGT